MKRIIGILIILVWYPSMAGTIFASGRQDSLRGGNGPGRDWWDVSYYQLQVRLDTSTRSVYGVCVVVAQVSQSGNRDSIQIDLQEPMVLDSAMVNGIRVQQAREGNVYWLTGMEPVKPSQISIHLYYHGSPRQAKHAPWDGGLIWTRDSTGKTWMAVACQGLGASAWWPCKDYQADEPDSMDIWLKSDGGAPIISNGRLSTAAPVFQRALTPGQPDYTHWKVTNPINTYNATFYSGDYIHWPDTLMGERGKLDISYYALRQNEAIARKHFMVTKQMLHCFEYWMGPYPFYEDGYKLVEAPYLGMEHQSAVAYGNAYRMGYMGNDRSGTGVGLLFDFIIVHESGHEWFGNNITAADVADNWLHEGFTTYTEALFAECAFGKEKAFQYTRGEWKNIRNDRNVIGSYGVQDDGSGDKYDKGSAVVHMVRAIINDDAKFRQLLRGLNKDFYHQQVTSAQVEQYISRSTGYDFAPLFQQYLRTTMIPVVEYYIKDKKLSYRLKNAVPGLRLPVRVTAGKTSKDLIIATEWQRTPWKTGYDVSFSGEVLVDFLNQVQVH
ncbi:MAG: M1 family peptidase [Sphingobacteriales bacterium]|nr:MAG: M1 family peptidase [Sphingobacteriales bacterium]